MAKSARATSIKKNKSGLKKKVFGPVEAARNERLSAKLLELAQQPKPLRAEMEVEDGDSKDADAEAKEEQQAVGALPSLSTPVPASLLTNDQLPTPPDSPPLDAPPTTPILGIPAQKALAKELLFYHLLGVSSDILGFNENGDLQLGFARDRDETMEVDGTAAKGNGFRLERNEKQKQHKAARVSKTRHRRGRNNIVFEKTGKAKAAKKGSKR